MKNINKVVFCFGLFFIFGIGKVSGIERVDIRTNKEMVILTNTPTPNIEIIKQPLKDILIEVKALPTSTPTPVVVTQIITATPGPTVSLPTLKPEETTVSSELVTQSPETTPEIENSLPEESQETNSDVWFWAVVIGLLGLIWATQIWSNRRNNRNQNKKN